MLLDTVLPSNRSGKVVEVVCDTCSDSREVNWGNYKTSQETRGWDGLTLCRKCRAVETGLRRKGSTPWNKGKKLPPSKLGENHPSWRGGTYIDYHGYVMVHIGAAEGRSKWSSYRKLHILVMEKHIGRRLKKGEAVHHVNGDKLDNSLRNLYLASNSGHRMSHQSLQQIGYELVKLGLVNFNTDTGKYVAHIKWGELLGQLEAANQQPSKEGDFLEGSETRDRDSKSQ